MSNNIQSTQEHSSEVAEIFGGDSGERKQLERSFYFQLIGFCGVCASLAYLLTGCVGGGQNSTLNEIQEASGEKAAQSIVEGYIEYVGAPHRWAGPNSMIVYLNARNANHAEIQVTPAPVVLKADGSEESRNPASQTASANTEEVRRWLAELNEVANVPVQSAGGCLYPVRIRLVAQDSQVKEFVGCRGSMGWTAKMNEVTSRALAVAWGGN